MELEETGGRGEVGNNLKRKILHKGEKTNYEKKWRDLALKKEHLALKIAPYLSKISWSIIPAQIE